MSIADPAPESVDDIGNPNSRARRGQSLRWLLLISAATLVGGLVFYFMNFRPSGDTAKAQKTLEQRTLATASVAAPAGVSPEAENTRLRAEMSDLQNDLEAARQQNAQLATENAGLADQLANDAGRSTFAPGLIRQDKRSNGGAGEGGQSTRPTKTEPLSPPVPADPAAPAHRSIRLTGKSGVSADKERSAAPVSNPSAEKTSVLDSSEYVAPNSYVSARVLVGVDMQVGVSATADPKPVLFRIARAAVGVGSDGRYQTSNLKGCLVNGAAFAELSSEKVYVKLQRISCPLDDGRYLVSQVDGYVTYMGKSGIRGRVVTREGNYATKAFAAGTLQGLGQAMSLNNQRSLAALDSGGAATSPLSSSDIAQSAAGSGLGNASSMLADYYIKRAEQYQPVIEMATGMEVELVFLDSFRFTAKGPSK